MKQVMSLPLDSETLAQYSDIQAACRNARCDGIEAIWGGTDIPDTVSASACIGYHLTFYPDWLDFWREDKDALRRKFGSDSVWQEFYGGSTRQRLLDYYAADLDRAAALGAEYVVYHVSDVSVDEGFTFDWLHTDAEVIDAAAEVINLLLDGRRENFAFLMENQWWPGLTFTDSEMTRRLLDRVEYENKGIMLDFGHLMCCNPRLRTEADGVRYLHAMLDAHRNLSRAVRGVHLHQSLSGEFLQNHTGWLPENLSDDYYARYSASYGQVMQIDRHEPWHDPQITTVLDRIAPEFLVHELRADCRSVREQAIAVQQDTLMRGWGKRCSQPIA